jgi:2-dehydro-3-deoxyphosphooctonate aldolase (KDO 8-P synthase)
MRDKTFKIGSDDIGLKAPMFLIAGPCVIETKQICLDIAKRLADISSSTGVSVIFKASFD